MSCRNIARLLCNYSSAHGNWQLLSCRVSGEVYTIQSRWGDDFRVDLVIRARSGNRGQLELLNANGRHPPLQRLAYRLLVTTTALLCRVPFRPLGMMQTGPMHDFRILYLGRTGLVVSVNKPHILPDRAVFLPPEIQTRCERTA